MLPIPSIDYIPKIFKDKSSVETLALTDKIDENLLLWLQDVKDLENLLDVDRCPENFLLYLGNMLNAGATSFDSDRGKRQKIHSAVKTHKKRGSWIDHAKIVIDAVTGYSSSRFTVMDSDDWILCGDGLVETGTDWSLLGGDGTHPYGMSLLGAGDEVEIWGNVYINCHEGVYTSTLTAEQIETIVFNISDDIVPAYVRVYLGYEEVSGGFIIYAGGTIG
jgi:hypothetical protein